MRILALSCCLCLALPLLGGCQSVPPAEAPPAVRATAGPGEPLGQLPHLLPPIPHEDRMVPIGLDTVLRLAQDRNGQVQIARAKLEEAYADQDIARKSWLPQLVAGPSYYRHEGGIQDFQGNLINSSYGSVFGGVQVNGKLDPRDAAFQRVEAERKVWQQRGELSKLTTENLLDAAGTYIDLMAARTAESVSLQNEKMLTDLVVLADKLARVDPGSAVEVTRVQTELRAQQVLTRKLREGGNSAAAKLSYLLGLDPACDLVLIEDRMVALCLADVHQPTDALVERALTNGPGVRELEAILRLIDDARARGDGAMKWLPAFEVCAAEGAFGAGPGDSLRWDNRFDLGIHARWNLTDALVAKERRRQADAKTAQARLGYQELRAKLTLGVREAKEAILSGQDQLCIGEDQVKHAADTYDKSASRFRETIKGRNSTEVLMAIRTLGGARLQLVQALRELDKAQLRLFVLTGAAVGGDGCLKR